MYIEQLKDFLTGIIMETDRKKTYIAQARLPVERVSPESNGRLLLAPRLPDLPPHQDAPPALLPLLLLASKGLLRRIPLELMKRYFRH